MTGDLPEVREAQRPRNNTALWIWIGAAGLLLIGALLYFSFSSNPLIVKYRELARLYSSRKEVKHLLERAGPYAPIVFIVLQALQVVLAPIPGEATGFLGGWVFGTGLGFVYSSVGLALGSMLAFGLGRWLGLPLVHRLVSEQVYHKFDFVARTGGVSQGLPLLSPGGEPPPLRDVSGHRHLRTDARHVAPLHPGSQGGQRPLHGVCHLPHHRGRSRPPGLHLSGGHPPVDAAPTRDRTLLGQA